MQGRRQASGEVSRHANIWRHRSSGGTWDRSAKLPLGGGCFRMGGEGVANIEDHVTSVVLRYLAVSLGFVLGFNFSPSISSALDHSLSLLFLLTLRILVMFVCVRAHLCYYESSLCGDLRCSILFWYLYHAYMARRALDVLPLPSRDSQTSQPAFVRILYIYVPLQRCVHSPCLHTTYDGLINI